MRKTRILAVIMLCAVLCACSPRQEPTPTPTPAGSATPSATKLSGQIKQEPELKVYIADSGETVSMMLEEYLEGVLAGEMKNDWPMEALKAQAIIARTFVERFMIEHGGSKYEGADISTDIEEAQAYDAAGVNDRVKDAINQTRGLVLTYDGQPALTWFHSHSGGRTALAQEGLGYKENPPYIKSVESEESDKAPEDVKSWTAEFTKQEVIDALGGMGVNVASVSDFKIAEKGDSGRATRFSCEGQTFSAPSFRINLDSMKLKSTMITSIEASGDKIVFSGEGYGHGVGLSQWGAYELAEQGLSARDIVLRYYEGAQIEKLWE